MLTSVRAARVTRLTELLSATNPGAWLPPELGLVDFYEEREEAHAAAVRCRAWKSVDPSLRIVRERSDTFRVNTDRWTGLVEYYGRGDFNADGYEDLLVERVGKARGGSYAAAKLFLLTRTENDACIRIAMELGRP